MKGVLTLFFIWLAVVNLFAVIANNRLTLSGDAAYVWQEPEKYEQVKTWNPIPLHAQWDSVFYLYIAEHGYAYSGEGLSNIVFFPLYPLLIKAVAPLVLGYTELAGIVVSCVSLFFALWYFRKLIEDFHPKIHSTTALIYLLIFPTAFFLNAIYTEALFLAISLASFYYARKEHFFTAGLLGLAAALTRPTGFLLAIPLAVEVLRAKKRKPYAFLTPTLPLLGPLFFFSFHAWQFGDFLAFFKVEKAWGRALEINADHFTLLTPNAVVNFGIDVLLFLAACWACIFVMRRVRLSYGIYILATLALALSTGTLLSIGRFALVLFPVFMAFAMIRNTYVKLAIAFASVLLFALDIVLFVNGYWAG